MKLILDLRHRLSFGDEFFHDLHIVFITGFESEAGMNHECLVLRRSKFPLNVSSISVLGGVVKEKR